MIREHVAAFVLPFVAAAAVLAGVASNRRDGRGPTVLSDRELTLGARNDDRTIAEVWLTWTTPAGPDGGWLTPTTLQALGFDVSMDADAADAAVWYRRQLSRRVYVAFEIAGPAWEAARADVSGRRLLPEDGAAWADRASRLVPVDVDLDARRLAARYPDPRTHLIARAVVRPQRYERPGGAPYIGGQLVTVDPRRIQVPLDYSAALPVEDAGTLPQTPFSVSLMYGRRWEPWVVDVSRGDASRSSAAEGSTPPRRSDRSSRRDTVSRPGSP